MGLVSVSVEQRIAAAPDIVHGILVDYHERPYILAPRYLDFTVEEGGTGAGTIISYKFVAGGRERDYRLRVEEPEPGRVIVEDDLESSLAHTWTLTPDGDGTVVRIDTRWQGAGGIGGIFERLFAPKGLRAVHGKVLKNLAERVEGR